MEITGVRTDTQRVKVEIDILEAFKEIDRLNRKRLGIPENSFLGKEYYKDDKVKLMCQEAYTYHGTPSDEVIDHNPSEEIIDYLLTYKKFYEYTHKTKYAKV